MANNHIPVFKNEKFGRLTVISLSKGAANGEHVLYKCVCDCGKILDVAASQLRRKVRTSCGCKRDEDIKVLGLKSRKQLTNSDLFGDYQVIKDLGTNKNRKAIYQVKCKCGHLTTMTGCRLRDGLKLNCYHV